MSECLGEVGGAPCERPNQGAVDACVAEIADLTCEDFELGLLPPVCEEVCSGCTGPGDCNDNNECTGDSCDPDGTCIHTPIAEGTSCGVGGPTCQDGVCVGEFPCTEQGIRDAIASGGGPHTFACNGPTTVPTQEPIVIDNDVILDGEGQLTVDGIDDHLVFSVSGSNVELRGFVVTGGRGQAPTPAGGITNDRGILTLTRTTISGNTGRGVYNFGTLVMSQSIVSDNTSEDDGGGIFNFGEGTLTLIESTVSGNSATLGNGGDGGGIYNSGASLTLIRSTVSGNSAKRAGGGILNKSGFGVLNESGLGDGGRTTLTLSNSTVSYNSAQTGGGIHNSEGIVTLSSSTLSGNEARERASAIYSEGRPGQSEALVTLRNTLIDGNCGGRTVSAGGNIESPGDTCGLDQATDQVSVTSQELRLGRLEDNGGPTLTQAPIVGSAAIDVIGEGDCVDADGMPLTTDQRGAPRPQGPRCDVGAVELEAQLCQGVDCDDGNDCTADGACNPANGMCEGGGNEPEGTPCDQDGGQVCDGAGQCVECNDASQCDDRNDCTVDSCNPASASCDHNTVPDDTGCAQGAGTCQQGVCLGQFPCTEQGIRDAIAAGGGPHAFACPGPTTVTTQAEIVIDTDVVLDGVGNLIVDGDDTHRVFSVPPGVTAELRRFTITGGGVPEPDPPGIYDGGALHNEGTLALTNCTVTRNAADFQLGAIRNAGILTLTDTVVSQNTGIEPSIVTGTGINNSGTLTLTGSTVSENSGNGIGGGGTMTLTRSFVFANSGTGIVNGGTLILTDTTVSGNTSASVDGAGGIANMQTATLINSTVSDNVEAGIANRQALTLINSTVSGNAGWGIHGVSTASDLTLIHTTVSNNGPGFDGSTIRGGPVTSTNSLIDGSCSQVQLESRGGNVESPGDTCRFDQPSDQVSVLAWELDLGPLRNNGGPTLTQLPGPESVAIDAVAEVDCAVATDQRGITRPQGPKCDAGAVEVEPVSQP
jgi:hypothetical protein